MVKIVHYVMARSAGWAILGWLAGLYAAQSVTGSMVQTALPVVLRDIGMPLDSIGYLSVLFLPWALKFLWAPMIDRFLNERTWILLCQTGITLCFIAAANLPPQDHMPALAGVLLMMGFLAATQDIATDKLAVHATTPETRGAASGASTAGAYLGFLIGGGIWLIVYNYAGWAVSMLAMAAFVVALSLPIALAKQRTGHPAEYGEALPKASLRNTLSNRALMRGLIFLLVYQLGLRAGSSMTGPYLVDKGVSLDLIGIIRGAGGAAAGFLAAVFGAVLVQKAGIVRSITLLAALNAGVLLLLAGLEMSGRVSTTTAIVLLIVQSAAVAMSFVAVYAAMMNWCNPHQAATDFAVLQSIDAVLAIAAASVAGVLGQTFGYGWIFCFAAFLIAGALFIAPRLLAGAGPKPSHSQLPEEVLQK
ncbi:major facilitator superfamily protein [Nitratireductor aquibiodomus RA22]|uniref:Major facilitator superfamily protein n=2 Tax=Nitratireductor aquibiodomus TaxID=204799 RepID=I5C5C5_9HYPH|nr:MFS transporter [Nitratireductor aquibiodomus]EIM77027.1 major facilitator superfamily protein [Nitratireductor aquibiodomus RA22]